MKVEKVVDIQCRHFDNTIAGDPGACRGNTMIVRVGDRVFATFMQQEPGRAPYNQCCLELYEKRGDEPWKLAYRDEGVFQLDPAPIVYLGDNRLAVTANPPVAKYAKEEESKMVNCTPVVYLFDIAGEVKKVGTFMLPWNVPGFLFVDHSYRSLARDVSNGNLFFTNECTDYGDKYTSGRGMYGRRHIDMRCYTVLDKDFKIVRMGQISFPKRGIHLCVGMNQGETYVFSHSGPVEDNAEWHQFKYELTGDTWDYVERQAMITYSPDIAKEDFEPTRIFHDRSDTCGWVENLDCCFTENGDLLLLFSEETIRQPIMQERFFPDVNPEAILWVYRFSHGELVEKTMVHREPETAEKKVCYGGFFHTAADGKIYAVWNMGIGKMFLNRHIEVVEACRTYLSDVSDLTKTPVQLADTAGHVLFGNKTRQGALPGDIVDLYYLEANAVQQGECMMHAQYDLNELKQYI